MADKMLGGYTLHECVGEKEKTIFDHALSGLVGVDYKPLAVASQIVSGVNYVFICTGTPVVAHPETGLYAISIFTKFAHSVGPQVEINSITPISMETFIK